MFDVPEGYSLNLSGRGDQWTARLIPDGHSASKWSPPAVEAKARTAEEAIAFAKAKCLPAQPS
jgi:hypothetical protein